MKCVRNTRNERNTFLKWTKRDRQREMKNEQGVERPKLINSNEDCASVSIRALVCVFRHVCARVHTSRSSHEKRKNSKLFENERFERRTNEDAHTNRVMNERRPKEIQRLGRRLRMTTLEMFRDDDDLQLKQTENGKKRKDETKKSE